VAHGSAPLLDDVDLHVERGERIGLLGRNGAGKSTLLAVLAGDVLPDRGKVDKNPLLRVGMLPQEVPTGLSGTIYEVVAAGAGQREGAERSVESVLSRLSLDPHAEVATLSAGMRRRVLLARALACEPDLLLLDEPTNHLDIASIVLLEELLLRLDPTLVFVTHDRALLTRLATRIVELDRGRLYSFPGDYQRYLARREQALAAEAVQAAVEDKKLAAEEAWLRQGVKARRTRNEGRVRALERLRAARRERRERVGQVKMAVAEAERSGKLVIEAKGIRLGYGDQTLVRDLSTVVMAGDKVGIIGPNGCGKTTLIRALLGELPLQAGSVRVGVRVQVAYFDQLRAQLDPEQTVMHSVAEGQELLQVNGLSRHVIGYLGDFLFNADRARAPVSALSGGERNRLLLARLFLRPSNLLVLDEPTNDLDIDTLELLEERLIDYSGTVLVVSHDRAFLDNVVTSSLVFEGNGVVREYAGGYQESMSAAAPQPPPQEKGAARGAKPRTKPRKLTFDERAELAGLPERIEAIETELAAVQRDLGDPGFYQRQGSAVGAARARAEALEHERELAYARWQELEAIDALTPR
jgi:ATP-binding cassette subfamily F protein uup